MQSGSFNNSVHGLRGFAAFSVVLFHIWAGAIDDNFLPSAVPDLLKISLTSLSFGVDLFFMISGYLITQSLISNKNVLLFLKNRCIRIYPAFLPVLLLIFIFGPFIGYDYFNDRHGFFEWLTAFAANLLFLPGVFPMEPALLVAWTLSYEAAFYIFSAIAFSLYMRRPGRWTLFAIVAAAA